MRYCELIERPLGSKVKYVRITRRAGVYERPYLRETAQVQRRRNLPHYRATHGKPIIFPPINQHNHTQYWR